MTNVLDSPAFRLVSTGNLLIQWSPQHVAVVNLSPLIISSPSSSLSEGTIVDIIASLMVLPNRMCVPLIDQVKVDQMRFPLPRVCEISFAFNVLIFISSPALAFSFHVRKYCEFESF